MKRLQKTGLCALALAALVAGCGGDDDEDSAGGGSQTQAPKRGFQSNPSAEKGTIVVVNDSAETVVCELPGTEEGRQPIPRGPFTFHVSGDVESAECEGELISLTISPGDPGATLVYSDDISGGPNAPTGTIVVLNESEREITCNLPGTKEGSASFRGVFTFHATSTVNAATCEGEKIFLDIGAGDLGTKLRYTAELTRRP